MASTITDLVTSAVGSDASATLGLAAVLMLISCLVIRELASASDDVRAKLLSRNLTMPIMALLLVFAFIATMTVFRFLS